MKDDVLIIGGGASGLCAAVALKQQAPALSVRILESLPRVGKKLSATGNGRCNITNRNITLDRYHGRQTGFAKPALERFDNTACEAFFNSLGVLFIYEEDKAYPASLQAASVTDCLRFAVEKCGVKLCTETTVTNIQRAGNGYKVIAGALSFYADRVIVAAGLYAGGEAYGCTGGVLEILRRAGFETVPINPSLVQIKTETDLVRSLKGVKMNALARLVAGDRVLRQEAGEVLFCDYGLSGPPILQISRGASGQTGPLFVSLDLFPEQTADRLTALLTDRAATLSDRRLEEFFTGMLQKRLGQVVLKAAGLRLNDPVTGVRPAAWGTVAGLLKEFRFRVTGTTGHLHSQVTAGGLATSEFDPNTMQSLQNPGLYAIGEILDIDGDCGGFNLQWAWSSALCAAADIVRSSVC